MSSSNPFLGGLGNSNYFFRDWQHAARLYVDDVYRLAPKPKWMYYAVFNINESATARTPFQQQNQRELNYLVKKMDLPKYTMDIERLNQYNRKTTSYTKITYDPVNITFHDDNNGVTNALWALYYGYYIADRLNVQSPYTDTNPIAYQPHTYDTKDKWQYRYGLDNGVTMPFFSSIQLVTLTKHKFTSYLLCNPKITSWQHDTMDQNEGNGIVENQMSVIYDAVIYTTGTVSYDNPSGFAVLHYDNTPSPLGPSNQAYLQGAVPQRDFSLYAQNSFNPIDTAIGLLSNFVQTATIGNRLPYGWNRNIANFGNIPRNTTSGLQNYNINVFEPSATLPSRLDTTEALLYNTEFNTGTPNTPIISYSNTNSNTAAPIDRSFSTGSSTRANAIQDEFAAVIKGANPENPPIIFDAYTNSLPRDTSSSIESKIFSDVDRGTVLPETTGAVNMNYFNVNDVQPGSILQNELIRNNPQTFDIPDDPFNE